MADARQRDYYEQTATQYEQHLTPGDEHYVALEYILGLAQSLRAASILDVGAGTGRAVEFLRARNPALRVVGVEPVAALRQQAFRRGIDLVDGSGQVLPFASDSFDVVIATGVLHHIAKPEPVVTEMTRVARTAVMISDANRFGQGRPAARIAKYLIHRGGGWEFFERLRTRGRGYMESEGDGIFYSYSIYDALPSLRAWGDRAFIIPTLGNAGTLTRLPSVMQTGHGLLVATREGAIDDWAHLPSLALTDDSVAQPDVKSAPAGGLAQG